MNFLYFPEIARLQEDIKEYLDLSPFQDMSTLLQKINEQRLKIATLAAQRMIFYEQTNIIQSNAGETQTEYFDKGDIKSILRRGIASLNQDVSISLTHQGTRELIYTRNFNAWQFIWSVVQNVTTISDGGQQIPFDFPTEIYLNEKESIQIDITNQDTAGFIFWHGCNLIDNSVNVDLLRKEIAENVLPEAQYIPLIYEFVGGAGTYAQDGQGKDVIYSAQTDRSCILTHVAVANSVAANTGHGLDCQLTLIDDGRNQTICDLVEMRGIAGDFTNKFTGYYPLPYPLLLPRKDRLKAKILNGSNITNKVQETDDINYLNFAGFTI